MAASRTKVLNDVHLFFNSRRQGIRWCRARTSFSVSPTGRALLVNGGSSACRD
jgi:hypothetical protein